MMWTGGPRGVDERVVQVLLNVIHDEAGKRRGIAMYSTPRGCFDDDVIKPGTDSRLDIRANEHHHPSQLFGGYATRGLEPFAFRDTRRTRRYAMVRDQMVVAVAAAAQGAGTPARRAQFAAT